MKNITKDQFVGILKDAGITEEQMQKLHHSFEARYPEQHESFLKHLGLPDRAVEEIRQRSAK